MIGKLKKIIIFKYLNNLNIKIEFKLLLIIFINICNK